MRSVLHTVHLWVGLALGAPLVVLGLTGSVLVFDDTLAAWLNPPPKRASFSGEPRPLGTLVAAARAAAPGGVRPTMIALPETDDGAVMVRLSPVDRPAPAALEVYVDPVTARVLDARNPSDSLLRRIFLLHANAMTRDRSGREVIGWLGVAMCALGVSGLVMWLPRRGAWRHAYGIRPGARGDALYRDLHATIGVSGWVVFLAVSASGVYLAFPQTLGSALTTRDLRVVPRVAPAAAPPDLDAVVAVARNAVPGTAIRSLTLPARPDQAVRVNLLRPGHPHGAPSIAVFVDPGAQQVVEVRDPSRYSLGETIVAWQHAVHAGDAMGYVWKLLVFLSGLLPAVFAATGLAMWTLRRRTRKAIAQPAE